VLEGGLELVFALVWGAGLGVSGVGLGVRVGVGGDVCVGNGVGVGVDAWAGVGVEDEVGIVVGAGVMAGLGLELVMKYGLKLALVEDFDCKVVSRSIIEEKYVSFLHRPNSGTLRDQDHVEFWS
jgi:hypothetical protein